MATTLDSNRKVWARHVSPKHSAYSERLNEMMEASRAISERLERGEITAHQAVEELNELKNRHRTLFQRILGS